MFCKDVRESGFDDNYVKEISGFSKSYTEALDRVTTKEYYVKKDMVNEFCSVGIYNKVDVSSIDMKETSMILTFNLSDSRSVEVLVAKYWLYKETYINAYCRVINDALKCESFFIIPISNVSHLTFKAHKAMYLINNECLEIWKVIIHSIMSDIDILFEERDGILVSKSVDISDLRVFDQFVAGHFKRVRYGSGRKYSKSVYVKAYWRSDGR